MHLYINASIPYLLDFVFIHIAVTSYYVLDTNVLVGRVVVFFFSSRRRHTRLVSDWSSDVCSSDLTIEICFAATGGPGRSHVAVDIQTGAQNRRITHPPGYLPGQTTGRCHSTDFTLADRKSVV